MMKHLSDVKIGIEKKLTLLVALLMLARFIRVAPIRITDYIAEQYLISYKYGFIARGFMGTLLSGFSFLSLNKLYLVGLIVEFVMTVLYLLLVYRGMCIVPEEHKVEAGMSVIIFSMSPMSPAFTYALNNFGRFDAILIAIVIVQFLLMLRPSALRAGLVVILSVVGILIHPIFVFTYFVVGELLLLHYAIKSERSGRTLIFLIVNTILICSLFLFFEYARPVGAGWTQDLMYNDMQSRTNFDLGDNFYGYLNEWYFETSPSQMEILNPFSLRLFATICFMLPYEIICFKTWWKGVRTKRGMHRFFYICLFVSFIATIPAFVLEIDYGRWCAAYYLSQCMIFIYLLFVKDDAAYSTVLSVKSWVKDGNYLPAVACLVYSVSLGWFKDISMIELSGNGWLFFSNLFNLLRNHF